MKQDTTCRIPVTATMQIINGEPVMVSAEYADIPAEDIAKFIVERFGASAVFGGNEDNAEDT